MLQRLADRLGVSVNVIYLSGAALLVVLLIVVWRRRVAATNPASATGAIVNGPWSSGADTISANPHPTSPDGGADHGSTPAAQSTTPTISPVPVVPAPTVHATDTRVFVHPTAWPTRTSTLSGIASQYGTSLSAVEAFPENQYIRARNSWDLIYTTDTIRVR